MQHNLRPAFKAFNSSQSPISPIDTRTPIMQNLAPPRPPKTMNVKRVTLTSKKNWWMGAQCYLYFP